MTIRRKSCELKVTEGNLSFVFEDSSDGQWIRDIGQGKVYFSALCNSMLGYENNEISNQITEWTARIHRMILRK